MNQGARGQWTSRLGFVLAAAGSAVGLGNVWKFPYITGENGGGLFVLVYLACIAVVGLPLLIAEVVLGRAAERAPAGAYAAVSGERTPWRAVGWLHVVTGLVILSFYSVVAGWSLHYVWLSLRGAFAGAAPEAVAGLFDAVQAHAGVNLFWHLVFMGLTTAVVATGVQRGIEAAAKVLMPALFVLLGVLLVDAVFQRGFPSAVGFLFAPKEIRPAAVLEALGHSFFTLSIGMGAMLTYGSYLPRDTDVTKASGLVAVLDTAVALVACLVLFPIIFSFGMAPEQGAGLVFKSVPISLNQMPGGSLLGVTFFTLLFFAALTSGISLLEVVVSSAVDQLGWGRRRAALVAGTGVFLLGIPSALSGATRLFGGGMADVVGKSWFDGFDYLASNWLLPVGGLAIAIYVGWVMPEARRRQAFTQGSSLPPIHYGVWLVFLRFVAPLAILAVFLHLLGVI